MIEGPYTLPQGWRWVRLGEVCEIASGGTPKRSVSSYWGGDIPWVKISDIPEDGWVSHAEENITMEGLSSSSAKIFPEGTILFSIFATVGKVGILKIKAATNQAIAGLIVVCPDLDRHYVFYALKSVAHHAKIAGRGMAQHNINLTILRNLSIPLPPLEEQRRIVARIEELMARVREARRLREQAREDAERLWQSVLAETFPRLGSDLPQGWRWVRLGEVAKIFSGSPAPQGKEYFEQGTFPFVRVQDLGRHGITTDLKETADKVNERAAREFRLVKASKGTILFPKSGAAILTNSRAILGTDAYIVSHLAGISPNIDVAEPLWVFYWLCTVDMSEYVDNLAYPSFRLSKVREILIPLPPLEEQRRIVARLDEVRERIQALKKAQEETEARLRDLERSILDKAFRGEL